MVKLIRKLFALDERGEHKVIIEYLPPQLAVYEALFSPDNGVIYMSARIEWGEVIDIWPAAYQNYAVYNGDRIIPKGYG